MVATLVAAVVVLLGVPLVAFGGGPSTGQAERPVLPPASSAAAPPAGEELVAARTETSRTWELESGERVTRSYAAPVNFRRDGRLVPIDTDLVASAKNDIAYAVERNAFAADLPNTAADAVRVRGGDSWLEFGLRGARGAARRTARDAVEYADALPGVTVELQSTATGLKESLILSSRPASSTFAYDVRLAEGLDARLASDGRVEFHRGREVVFVFEAPYAQDAKGDVGGARYALRRRAGELEVRVVVDRAWLAARDREFPVVVDPTTTYVSGWAVTKGSLQETYVQNDQPATRHDNLATLRVGKESASRSHAALLKFDMSGVPKEAIVLAADLGLYLQSKLNTTPAPLHVHDMSGPWTTAATWTSSGTASWTGGGPTGSFTSGSVTPTSGWTLWRDLKTLAEGWTNGSLANNGIKVDECCETPLNRYDFAKSTAAVDRIPYMQVRYEMRQGTLPSSTFWAPTQANQAGITPDLGAAEAMPPVAVNAATGNLVLSATDRPADLAGPDNLAITRTYNSVWWGALSHGTGWTSNTAAVDVTLTSMPDGSIMFRGPTNSVLRFARKADGTYEPAAQTDATLTVNSAGEYAVRFTGTGEQFIFLGLEKVMRRHIDAAGAVTSWNFTTDAQGRAIDGTATDAGGRWTKWFFEYGAGHRRTERIETQDGHVHRYGYDANSNLTTYTAPDGKVTRYEWEPGYPGESAIRLNKIVNPDGSEVRIGYTTSGFRRAVTSYTTRAPGATVDGPTTRFAYTDLTASTGKTTVTAPNGTTTDYFWDANRVVDRVTAGPNAPTVALTGSLFDRRGTLLPQGQHTLSAATSGASATTRIDVLVDGGVVDAFSAASASWSLDTADFAPGAHTITVVATAANGSTSSRSISVITPEIVYGDGTIPGELPVDPSAENAIDASACEAHFGTGSQYCFDPAGGVTALAATTDLIYGIADDDVAADRGITTSYLANPLFRDLKVRRVRRVLPWNIMSFPSRLAAFERFYKAARNATPKIDVMVSFQLGCVDDANVPACYRASDAISGNEAPPSQRDYVAAIRAFKARFRMVRSISAWNEPNHPRQPTQAANAKGGPSRAARYTYWLERYVCRPARVGGGDCNPLAAELYQNPGGSDRGYLDTYIRTLTGLFAGAPASLDLRYPDTWAYHPYTDVKNEYGDLTRTGIHRVLKRIGSDKRLWFTEVGSRVDNARNNAATQAREVDYLVDKLATWSKRIDRVYYYSMCPGDGAFDSGLLGPRSATDPYCGGAPRAAYTTWKTRTLRNPNG